MPRYVFNIRRISSVLSGMLVAFAPPVSALVFAAPAGASAEYSNASIADKALQYVGRWGGDACIDSHKPGDAGGQCRSFVNCVIWMTSDGTQNLGGRDYFSTFLAAGGQEITSTSQLQKGDIVQEGQGLHTFIIVKHVADNSFTVVDSNHRWDEKVSTYDRQVTLNAAKRAFRMGTTTIPTATHVPTAAQTRTVAASADAQTSVIGALDSVEAVDGGVTARGWVIDKDVTRPTYVQLFDASGANSPQTGQSSKYKADVPRLDVSSTYPGYGSSHGFRSTMTLAAGEHTICAYGVNAPGTPGSNAKLGCQTVTVK